MPYVTIQTSGGYLSLKEDGPGSGTAFLSSSPYRWRLPDYNPSGTFFSYVWASDLLVVACDGKLLAETGRAPFAVSLNPQNPLTFEYAGSEPQGPVYAIRAQGLGIYRQNYVVPSGDGRVWFLDTNDRVVWGVKTAD